MPLWRLRLCRGVCRNGERTGRGECRDGAAARAGGTRERAPRADQGATRCACARLRACRLPDALPQARRITSVNGAREATLVYLDHQVEVREGDALDGGYIVQRISPQARRVELKN